MITPTTNTQTTMINDYVIYLAFGCVCLLAAVIALLVYIVKEKSKKKVKAKSKKVISKGKIKGKHKKSFKIPRSVQDSIPYDGIYKNGMVKLPNGNFARVFSLSDANFASAPEEEQENILNAFAEVINLIPYKVYMETTIFIHNEDQQEMEDMVYIQPQRDHFNEIREDFNEKVLKVKMSEGNNNQIREKFLILSTEAVSEKEANNVFSRLEIEFNHILQTISPEEIKPVTKRDLLSTLFSIYNQNSKLKYGTKKVYDGTTIITEDLEWLNKQGLTSKDSIGPSGIRFFPSYFILGSEESGTYGATLFLKDMGTTIVPDITREITSLPFNMLVSTFYRTEREDKALRLLKQQLTKINADVVTAQKEALKKGYSPDLISEELLITQQQAKEALQNVMVSNQRVVYVTMVVSVFANSKEELKENVARVIMAGTKYSCALEELTAMQEFGFNTSLPLGYMQLELDRMLNTSSATAFHPYSTVDVFHPDGIWYGKNHLSKKMVMLERGLGNNYNAVTLGASGSGKSLSNKNEKSQVLMKYPHDSVYIIDPDNEYAPLAAQFEGQVVNLANGTDTHINPLDMDINYGDSIDEAIALKIDYLESLCDSMIRNDNEYAYITPGQRNIINRCGKLIYQPYIDHMKTIAHTGKTIDYEAMPTLVTFYETLLKQPEGEAKALALNIEMYCTGTKTMFAHTTNIDINSRLVIFNIKDLGPSMKELGIQVCMEYIWNKAISNSVLAKKLRNGEITKSQIKNDFLDVNSRTWIDIDEFHVLTQSDSIVKVIMEYWKRARKWDIILTALSQNFSDFMRTNETKAILKNSFLIQMMNLTPMDRQDAISIYNLSDSQLKYISNPVPGRGLLIWGEKTVIELDSEYPTECKLFKVLTTKSRDFLEKINNG